MSASMSARTPEDLGRLFTAALNVGDVDAVLALYEAESLLRPSPGQSIAGIAGIRQALLGFAAMKPTMTLTAKSLGQVGDIALITAQWELRGTGPDGKPLTLTGHSVEVARRQADGSWRYLIDSPWGLEWGV